MIAVTYLALVILPYVVVPFYVIMILGRLWFWMKLYNPALKLIPGPRSTVKVWTRQYQPTLELFPKPPHGVGVRLWRDVKGLLLFTGLFKRDKVLWFGSWLFHASITILFVVHLKWLLPLETWVAGDLLREIGTVAGWMLSTSCVYLLIRRLLVTRVRQITSFTDYLAEVLVTSSAATGLWVAYDFPVAAEVERYLTGLITLAPVQPAFETSLIFHLLSVELLLVVMPFSHLLHSGGIFISRRFLASPDTFSGDLK